MSSDPPRRCVRLLTASHATRVADVCLRRDTCATSARAVRLFHRGVARTVGVVHALAAICVTCTPPFVDELKLHKIAGIGADAFFTNRKDHEGHFHAEFYVPDPD